MEGMVKDMCIGRNWLDRENALKSEAKEGLI
jgi:hypothetical protein